MPAALAGPMNRVKTMLSTISLGQKIVIGLLLVGLLLGGFMFTRWITAPTMTPLFSNLAATDASAIVEELNAEGVPYELADGGGTIMVANEKVYDLRISLSGKGLPAENESGYSLLDEQGITTSEFQQQTMYQRALEGELANTLKALDGVRGATVHVALPKEDVFATEDAEPTASVLLDLAPGTKLRGEQIQAVTHLVSSSIEGMAPESVTVADQTGAVLSAAGAGATGGAGDAQLEQEQEFEARLAANAQQILDRVAGPGKAVVSVRADLDFSQRDTTTESYDYNADTPALSESNTTENYTGTGAAVGGILGAEDVAGGGGDSTYGKESTTRNNAVDKTVETVEGAPGAVQRLTVSVVMDDAVAGGLNQQQVQDAVSNAVGLDVARGDAISVASMAFDQSAAEQAAADLKAAQDAEKSAQMWSMIKTGGIALGIALLVLVVWLRSRRSREEYEEFEDDDEPLYDERIQVESVRDPDLDDRQAALESAKREKVRGEISEMVSERPDEVATMLRGWFAESK